MVQNTNMDSLSKEVAFKLGITQTEAKKATRAVLDSLYEAIVDSDMVVLQGYFSIEKCVVKGRQRNVFGKIVESEDFNSIKFKPSKRLMEEVRGS